MFTASFSGAPSQLVFNQPTQLRTVQAQDSFSNALLSQAQKVEAENADMIQGANKPTTLPSNQPTQSQPSQGSTNGSNDLTQSTDADGTTNGQQGSASSSGNKGAAASLASDATSATRMFNAQGNLSNSLNLKDFALLSSETNLVNQALNMARNISATQMAALQPSIMIQVGILQRLLSLLENNLKQKTLTGDSAKTASTNAGAAADDVNNAALAYVILDRFFKLVDPSNKNLTLARFFKKGPLGEQLHDEDTDDEFGTTYADVDAETDYIKRPRKEKSYMDFHYSMIS